MKLVNGVLLHFCSLLRCLGFFVAALLSTTCACRRCLFVSFQLQGEWQVQVKNTFIEVSDSDGSETEQDQGVLRRARSMPLF